MFRLLANLVVNLRVSPCPPERLRLQVEFHLFLAGKGLVTENIAYGLSGRGEPHRLYLHRVQTVFAVTRLDDHPIRIPHRPILVDLEVLHTLDELALRIPGIARITHLESIRQSKVQCIWDGHIVHLWMIAWVNLGNIRNRIKYDVRNILETAVCLAGLHCLQALLLCSVSEDNPLLENPRPLPANGKPMGGRDDFRAEIVILQLRRKDLGENPEASEYHREIICEAS